MLLGSFGYVLIVFPRRLLFFLGSYVLISKPRVPCGIYLNLRVSTFHAQARVLTFGFYKTGCLWRLDMCLFWSFGYVLVLFPGDCGQSGGDGRDVTRLRSRHRPFMQLASFCSARRVSLRGSSGRISSTDCPHSSSSE